MRLEPLYRAQFTTKGSWNAEIAGEHGSEGQSFLLVEGTCDGRIEATLHAANFPRRRTDGVFTPDFRGVLETADGAAVLFAWHGYGTTGADGDRRLVGAVTHTSGDPRYRWLNEVVGVLAGKVEPRPDGSLEVAFEVSQLVWEPF